MEKAQSVTSGKPKWTVMVYMAGDNLDGAALRDTAEMAKVGSTKDVNVLVQFDRIEDKLTRRFRITTIIAGHTHRAVFENLSVTERRYKESKVKTEIIKIKNEPDASYFNSGSCVHPQGITGLEISREDAPLTLVE